MAAKAPKYYHYSISELLDISTSITKPFDLSRLSFNAVRAGIVPALESSIMVPRESAVQLRGRGYSQQTTDSSYEQAVEYPVRQPINAPPEPRLQKDEGFAQFLKTHSSPNHTRVTAGGRIVPMEKRPAPPPFALSASKANQNTGSTQMRMTESTSTVVANNTSTLKDHNHSASIPTHTNTFGDVVALSNESVSSTVAPELVPLGASTFSPQQAALQSNIMMQNQLLTYGHGLSSGFLYPAAAGMANPTQLFGQHNPVNLSYLPYVIPCAQPSVTSSSLPVAWDLQSKLNEANNTFESYQQQLRELDRYRATHQRDETLIRQRLDVVNRRAEVKAEIHRLEETITFHENNQTLATALPQLPWSPPGIQQHAVQQQKLRGPLTIKHPSLSIDTGSKKQTPTKLNVAAAAYIPKSVCDPSPSSKSETDMLRLPATHCSRTDDSNPSLKATDSWGERVGQPPPELLHEQSLLAEHLLSEHNTPKDASDDDASHSGSARSLKYAGFEGSHLDPIDRAPPAVQAECKRLLDAMRKPYGMKTPVTLSDGQMQVVAGVELKPPAAENMTDFDCAYWNQKPEHTRFTSYDSSHAPSFTAKTSTMSFDDSVVSHDQYKAYRGSLQDSPSRQVLSELSAVISHNHKSMSSRSQQDDWVVANGKLQAQAASQTSGPIDCRKGIIPKAEHNSSVQEAFFNKTYSSTALQDVHATASLPRSLDGSVEANLRKMKASTLETKSPKSPKSPRSPFFIGFQRAYYSTK